LWWVLVPDGSTGRSCNFKGFNLIRPGPATIAIVIPMTAMGFAGLEAPWGALWPAIFELLPLEGREATRPVRFTSQAARTALDQVLAAESRADVIELLDEFITSDGWRHAAAGARPAEPVRDIVHLFEHLKDAFDRQKLDRESLDRTVGPTGTERCEEGVRAYRELMKLLLILVRAFNASGAARALPPQDPSLASQTFGLGDLLYMRGFPLGLRRHLLGIFRSLAAQLAIARAEERGDVAPWLSRALVDAYAAGPVHALASLRRIFTEGEVGSAALADTKAGEELAAAIDRWKQEAKDRGEEAYLPFGGHAEG
jgi:hypothetical protein